MWNLVFCGRSLFFFGFEALKKSIICFEPFFLKISKFFYFPGYFSQFLLNHKANARFLSFFPFFSDFSLKVSSFRHPEQLCAFFRIFSGFFEEFAGFSKKKLEFVVFFSTELFCHWMVILFRKKYVFLGISRKILFKKKQEKNSLFHEKSRKIVLDFRNDASRIW